MYGMTDETMALTVAETTMQEFLAAVMLAQNLGGVAPAPAPASSVQPTHPVITRSTVRRPPAARPASTAQRLRTPPATKATEPERVAGARTAYWVLLAGALATLALL